MCSYILLSCFVLFFSLSLIFTGGAGFGIFFLLSYIVISLVMFRVRDFSDKMHAKRLGRINYYADKEYEKKIEEENNGSSIK